MSLAAKTLKHHAKFFFQMKHTYITRSLSERHRQILEDTKVAAYFPPSKMRHSFFQIPEAMAVETNILLSASHCFIHVSSTALAPSRGPLTPCYSCVMKGYCTSFLLL